MPTQALDLTLSLWYIERLVANTKVERYRLRPLDHCLLVASPASEARRTSPLSIRCGWSTRKPVTTP